MSSKAELIEQAETLGIKVDKRWSVETLEKKVLGKEMVDKGLAVEVFITPLGDRLNREQAIEYVNERSMAQWSGQSPSLPVHERKRRIVKAMKEKGFDDLVEEIKWPV